MPGFSKKRGPFSLKIRQKKYLTLSTQIFLLSLPKNPKLILALKDFLQVTTPLTIQLSSVK
jgi:hypothetical protein